jgi:hypothetical protein
MQTATGETSHVPDISTPETDTHHDADQLGSRRATGARVTDATDDLNIKEPSR